MRDHEARNSQRRLSSALLPWIRLPAPLPEVWHGTECRGGAAGVPAPLTKGLRLLYWPHKEEEEAAGTTETRQPSAGASRRPCSCHRQQPQKWVWPRLPVGPALKHGGSLQKDRVPNGLQLWRKGHVEVTATADWEHRSKSKIIFQDDMFPASTTRRQSATDPAAPTSWERHGAVS